MTTDYKNLTKFEMAAVIMAAAGVLLIFVQIFIALPQETKSQVAAAFQVFEMNAAVAEVWEVEVTVNEYVFRGVGEFHREFYLAAADVFEPVGQDTKIFVSKVASGIGKLGKFSEYIALNYQNNLSQSGVETGMGGKVMGAFIEKLSQ